MSKTQKIISANPTATAQEILDLLFDELVPSTGKSENLAGEIARAVNRIAYRFYNDGDMLMVGYGRETVNPAGRFLKANGNRAIVEGVERLWREDDDDNYNSLLCDLAERVVSFLVDRPELENTETRDMWSYRNPKLDIVEEEEEF